MKLEVKERNIKEPIVQEIIINIGIDDHIFTFLQ